MHRMFSVLFCLLALVSSTAAQGKFDPEARVRTIAPFIDEQVIAVGHIDLTRVDAPVLVGRLGEMAKMEAGDIDRAKKQYGDLVSALIKAGAKEIFFIISLADLPNTVTFAVLPLEKDGDGKAVGKLLKDAKFYEEHKVVFDKAKMKTPAVVAGNGLTVQQIDQRKAVARPELVKAFTEAGDTSAQLVLVPTSDLRRALEETMPALPKEAGGGAMSTITRGLQWVAVGVELTPKMSLRVVIQSPDAKHAKDLGQMIPAIYKSLGQDKHLQEVLPEFEAIAKLLTPKVEDNRLILTLEDKDIATAIAKPVLVLQRVATRKLTTNNLKQLALAMHNYHDVYRTLPAQAIFDKDKKKPLLSWRVDILPYVGQVDLYKQFKLDEPWDSAHNKKLIAKMPAVFAGGNQKLQDAGKTPFVALVGKGFIFDGSAKGVRMQDILDGTSNTILAAEVAEENAVIWTKPDDLQVDDKQPAKGLRSYPGFLMAFADGSVRVINAKIDPKVLLALLTHSGGEAVGNID